MESVKVLAEMKKELEKRKEELEKEIEKTKLLLTIRQPLPILGVCDGGSSAKAD